MIQVTFPMRPNGPSSPRLDPAKNHIKKHQRDYKNFEHKIFWHWQPSQLTRSPPQCPKPPTRSISRPPWTIPFAPCCYFCDVKMCFGVFCVWRSFLVTFKSRSSRLLAQPPQKGFQAAIKSAASAASLTANR